MLTYFIAFWIIGWLAAYAILVRQWIRDLNSATRGRPALSKIVTVCCVPYLLTALFWPFFFYMLAADKNARLDYF